MAVWIDPTIEFIMREAKQDMGTSYEDLNIIPFITEEPKLMALVWNEGEIKTVYSMEQQGVYVSVIFEPQILGSYKRQVGRALYDFENALIGGGIAGGGHEEIGSVVHHNVGGHPIREEDMKLLDLYDTYRPLAVGRPGYVPANLETGQEELWWPEHIIQKVTVEGGSIKYDPNQKFWRGRLTIHAHIANAGFGGID